MAVGDVMDTQSARPVTRRKLARSVVATAVGLGALGAPLSTTSSATASEAMVPRGYTVTAAAQARPVPELIAHRGYRRAASENTIAAAAAAAQLGADAVEVDVRITRSRRYVLMHDRTVGRTTDCRGAVHHMRLADLAPCRTESGHPVPTLTELFILMKETGLDAYLELKTTPGNGIPWETGTIRTIENMAARHGLVDRVTVLAFSKYTLGQAAATNLRTGWYARPWSSAAAMKSVADVAFVRAPIIDKALIRAAKRRGVSIYSRTSDRPPAWKKHLSLGTRGWLLNTVPECVDYLGRVPGDAPL